MESKHVGVDDVLRDAVQKCPSPRQRRPACAHTPGPPSSTASLPLVSESPRARDQVHDCGGGAEDQCHSANKRARAATERESKKTVREVRGQASKGGPSGSNAVRGAVLHARSVAGDSARQQGYAEGVGHAEASRTLDAGKQRQASLGPQGGDLKRRGNGRTARERERNGKDAREAAAWAQKWKLWREGIRSLSPAACRGCCSSCSRRSASRRAGPAGSRGT